MKKSVAIIAFSLAVLFNHAQVVKFSLNGNPANATAGDCGTLKDLEITCPIPANVSSFDCYYIYLQLSSLDVPAYVYFSKEDIATYLKGKTQYTAAIIKSDLTSEFEFDDNLVSMKDLCFLPRIWKQTELSLTVHGAGFKIIGSHYETVWDDHQAKYITSTINDWDKGTNYGTGKFILKQQPLSEGISDPMGILNVKPANTANLTIQLADITNTESALFITDESLGFKIEFGYAIYADTTYSKEEIKAEILKLNTEGDRVSIYGGFEDAFNFMQNVSTEIRLPYNNSTQNAFSTKNFNGVTFEYIPFLQKHYFESDSYNIKLKAGMYLNFYVAQVGKYIIMINVTTRDVLNSEYESASFRAIPQEENTAEWFSHHLTPENIKAIDAVISNVMESTKIISKQH